MYRDYKPNNLIYVENGAIAYAPVTGKQILVYDFSYEKWVKRDSLLFYDCHFRLDYNLEYITKFCKQNPEAIGYIYYQGNQSFAARKD